MAVKRERKVRKGRHMSTVSRIQGDVLYNLPGLFEAWRKVSLKGAVLSGRCSNR